MVRQRIERLMSDFDLPTRDELEAVKAVAANARAGQEALERRVAELEAHVAGKTGGAETGTVSAPGPTGLGPDEVGGAGTEAAGPGAEANTPDGPAEARPAPAPSDPTSTSTKD